MWDKVVKHLAKYPSAVLTGMDGEGYPFSLRCKPEPDAAKQALKITLPDYAQLKPGPASILCHYHDDQLWQQTNFVLRGSLDQADGQWMFRPTQFIEGAGAGMSLLRQVREGRGSAKKYLAKRGLARPKIDWAKLKAIYVQAQKR
jgi:hypothetical protein